MPRLSSLALAGLMCLATPQTALAAPDPGYAVTNVVDVFGGPLAPSTRYAADPYANPYFLPDWDRNGMFGDAGDVAAEREASATVGPFRYPCLFADGSVQYRTTAGTCAAADTPEVTFRQGEARRLRVVDARGLALTATLWLPEEALRPRARNLPGLVFASGAFVAQRSYYMYDMAAAAAGFVVLSYDSQGQGTSEGRFPQDTASAPASGPCQITAVACRELQEMVRWFTGAPIRPAEPRLGDHDPAYAPHGENPRNPVLSLLDRTRIALAGQSMGGIAVSNYLYWMASGRDAEGQALPPVAAAVALSGFGPTKPVVPIQAQTADLDIPGVTAENWGASATDGPVGTKAWYDQLRGDRTGDQLLQLIISESGSHGDTANIPGAPHATWGPALSVSYFVAFLSCTVQRDAAACRDTVAPQLHLSQAYASEYVPADTRGRADSRCMTTPTKPSLGMAFDPAGPSRLGQGLLGEPGHTCLP